MMKSWKKVFLGIFVFAFFPQIVFASGLTCDNNSYEVKKVGSETYNFADGRSYVLSYYDTEGAAKTFCLDPGGQFSKGRGGYECKRMIDPTGETTGVGSYEHAFDVAATKAYALLVERGYNGTDANSREIGELVFRWLIFNYQLGTRKNSITNGSLYNSYFTMNYGGSLNEVWHTVLGEKQRNNVKIAEQIYHEAGLVGNLVLAGKSYDEIKALLPADDFEYTVSTSASSNNGRTTYTVTFNAPAGAIVWWDDFEIGVEGNARIENKQHASGSNVYKFDVYSPNNSKYSVYIDAYYYSVVSARTTMKILQSKVNPGSRQDMLIVANDSGIARTTVHGGQRVQLENKCVQKDGAWYFCDSNGENCTPDTEGICSNNPDTPDNPDVPKKTCAVENGTFYGVKGNVVTPTVFYDECCESGILKDEEYDLYCPCGDPDIDYIGNCSEFNSNSEIVNSVKDTEDGADLKTCLFNLASVDSAGNSVRMLDQTIVSSNPYCKVSCTEEYDFTLPNAKYTESGGYFNLSTTVSGKRTCYVNSNTQGNFNGVNYELFLQDLESARRAVIDAYNSYAPWQAAASKKSTQTSISNSGASPICPDPLNPNNCHGGCTAGSWNTTKYEKEWDWNTYDYSGNPTHHTDSYSSGSCTSCNCFPGINADSDHIKKRDDALNVLNQKIALYNEILRNYNNCTGEITTTTSNSISFPGVTSAGWETNLHFDPVIDFTYDEPYQNMTGFNGRFEKVSNNGQSTSEKYCASVGSDYNCQGASSVTTSPINQFLCTGIDCKTISITVGNARFATKTTSEQETYKPQNNFSVYTPMGTITLDKNTGLYTLLCKEKDCLPVSLNSPTGVFNFQFKFSNIGQYNDSNENGRLMGGTNNVFEAANLEAGYVCQYINNCPECDYVCVGEHCEIEADPDCPDCPFVCQNCIFDGQEMAYYYRTVSINNLFPSEREYGPNWNNEKGEYTKSKVQESGEETYREPEYSYTITANQMKRIREFNESVSGYLNTQMPDGSDALECFDLNGYENIYCISAFLDTEGNTYFKENKRNDIWTLWPDSGYYTNSTKYVVRDGLGPAWK